MSIPELDMGNIFDFDWRFFHDAIRAIGDTLQTSREWRAGAEHGRTRTSPGAG
jgi:hypothetical protein